MVVTLCFGKCVGGLATDHNLDPWRGAGWVPEGTGCQQRVCPSKYALNPASIMNETMIVEPMGAIKSGQVQGASKRHEETQ